MSPLLNELRPTVHHGGSDATTLAEGFASARTAILAAITALHGTEPNARDYSMDGNAYAFRDARNAYERQLRALTTVADEIAASWECVQDQIDARTAQRRHL